VMVSSGIVKAILNPELSKLNISIPMEGELIHTHRDVN